jgi:simple sugar transport system ATP-binding protein
VLTAAEHVISDASRPPASVVRLRGIEKSFGAVRALKGIDLSVEPGEVVGLVGDNGAGKSTLSKVLSGALKPDAGEIVVGDELVTFSNVRHARARGIEMLYQNLALCDDLNVAENFFGGREATWVGLLRRRWMHREARARLQRLGIGLTSTNIPVRALSGGQRQSLAIARAVAFSSRVLILDEPTAALGVRQSKAVLDLVRRVRETGLGVVFISHRMTDILAVCDRVAVLYEGSKVVELQCSSTSVEEIVNYIVTDPDAGRIPASIDISPYPEDGESDE